MDVSSSIMEESPERVQPTNNLKRCHCNVTRRQILFILSVFLTEIGCNYCMDIPGSLELDMTKYFGLTSSQFSLFYSLYYLPVIFTNSLGGYLIDRWLGIVWTTVLFSVISIVGSGIFAIGGLINTFWVMLLGRLLFGLGNEIATGVSVNYCMFAWYKHIMNFVATLNSNTAFLGTLGIFQTSPKLFRWLRSTLSYSSATDLGLVMLITSLVIVPTGAVAVWMTLLGPKEEVVSKNKYNKYSVRVSDVFKFPIVYWLICLFMGLQAAISTFSQYSQGLFKDDFGMSIDEASNAISVLNLTNIVVSIPLSLLVDRIGRNIYFVGLSALLAFLPHLLLYCDHTPYFAMVVLGVSQSLNGSAIWPMFGLTVNDKNLTGLCYGLSCSVNGLFLCVAPFIIGIIIDASSFRTAQLFYLITSAVMTGFIVLIYTLDKRSTGVLSMSPDQRKEISENMEPLNA